jgi:mono/diheme cytochrome c family protein
METPGSGQKDKLMKRVFCLVSVVALLLTVGSTTQAAQAAESKMTSPSVDEAETYTAYEPENAMEMGEISGADEYYRLCAVCHGEGARGDGPMSRMLKTPPPNLTLLAKNNGGHFPFLRVLEMIDGRNMIEVHGTREMPVWGVSLTRDYDQFIARTIELEVLLHLNSLQVK